MSAYSTLFFWWQVITTKKSESTVSNQYASILPTLYTNEWVCVCVYINGHVSRGQKRKLGVFHCHFAVYSPEAGFATECGARLVATKTRQILSLWSTVLGFNHAPFGALLLAIKSNSGLKN